MVFQNEASIGKFASLSVADIEQNHEAKESKSHFNPGRAALMGTLLKVKHLTNLKGL